jgi:type IV pilus assembly protein PilC
VPPYKYVAYTADKRVIEGTLDAPSEKLAREAVERSGYRLLALKGGRARLSLSQAMPSLFGAKPQDVIVFSRLLATLLERGTDIITALQLLREQIGNAALSEAVSSIILDLNQGNSFSEAVGKHPGIFPSIYRQMIKVSEHTGNLEIVLRQVADHMEAERKTMKKVSKALVYPAFVLVAAIGVIGIMMTVVLPSLLGVLEQTDAELPIATRILMGLSGFLSSYKLNVLAIVAGMGMAAYFYTHTPNGRRALDWLFLRLPILGRINLLRDMSNFSRTVSMMLKAGTTMTETMNMAVQTARNGVIRDALNEVRTEMLKGQGLARPMAANGLFPHLLVQMVRVGEEADTLGQDLEVITDVYTQEIDDRVSSLVSLLEPCMILVLGTIVAFIAIAVIMPTYSIMGTVG